MSLYGDKASQLYELLLKKGIKTAEGTIHFDFLDVNVEVSDKSSVGNLLQEWLGAWMEKEGFYHREEVNSQIPPDFYLGKDDKHDLLEIKSFDYSKSPNFDVANFDAYARSLRTDSFRLDADYLIFGYSLENGRISIKDLWLKKIWEITCPSTGYSLKIQSKQKVIYNIRPYNFKSSSGRGFQPFENRKDFIAALHNTIAVYREDMDDANLWLEEVSANYQEFSGKSL